MNPYLALIVTALGVSTAVILVCLACEILDAIRRRRNKAPLATVSTMPRIPAQREPLDDVWDSIHKDGA